MTGQTWLGDLLAGVMLLTGAYCLLGLVNSVLSGRQADQLADGTHALMGVSMAGMLTANLKTLPNGIWALLFGLAAVCFGWRAFRDLAVARRKGADRAAPGYYGHAWPVLLMCGAMVYMLLAGTAMGSAGTAGGTAAMTAGGSRLPFAAFALAMALAGYAIWATDRLGTLTRAGAHRPTAPLSLRLTACCQIVMALVMSYMLVMVG
jgi:hypothetical protein